MRLNKKPPLKSDKTQTIRGHKRGVVGYSRKSALLEEAITQMNAGKYGRSSTALKELLALDPQNMEARRLFATLHLRLGSLIPARQAFDSLISEAFQRQDFWLAESLLREYLAAGPRCVPFLEKLGMLYQEKGDALEAVAEYGKAIDILIEDPDPDNPHHADQLYATVRELAPASPEAFRLASFFDARTGELLAREPLKPEPSSVAPSLDMPEAGQGIRTGPELMDGIMPWEIQDSRPTPDSFNTADVSESLELVIPPTITDPPSHQGPTFDGELVPSGPSAQEQTANSEREARGGAPKDSLTQECESVASGPLTEGLTGQIVPGGSYPFTPSVEPAAERSEAQYDLGSAVSLDGPVIVQEQDRVLVEAEPEPPYDVSGPSVSALTEPIPAQESLISSAQPIEDTGSIFSFEASEPTAGVMPSPKIEEISAVSFLKTDPSTDGPMEAEKGQPYLGQPVEADSKEVVTEQASDTGASSSLESVLAEESSQPWKQPGFSWESVFNRAWKFGSDHSSHVSLAELSQTNVEEAPTQPAAASPNQEQVLDKAVEIPEREESLSLGDQTFSGSPIAPMPWDHVQESVIAIAPAQADPPMAENSKPAVNSSFDPGEPYGTAMVSESLAQLPPSPDISAETNSFSIAQTPQAPVSPEPEISVADFEQPSFSTERVSPSAESEPQFRVVSAPTMDESPLEEAVQATIVSSVVAHEPVADEVISPTECPPQSADAVLSTDDNPAIAAALSLVQESYGRASHCPVTISRRDVEGGNPENPASLPSVKSTENLGTIVRNSGNARSSKRDSRGAGS